MGFSWWFQTCPFGAIFDPAVSICVPANTASCSRKSHFLFLKFPSTASFQSQKLHSHFSDDSWVGEHDWLHDNELYDVEPRTIHLSRCRRSFRQPQWLWFVLLLLQQPPYPSGTFTLIHSSIDRIHWYGFLPWNPHSSVLLERFSILRLRRAIFPSTYLAVKMDDGLCCGLESRSRSLFVIDVPC